MRVKLINAALMLPRFFSRFSIFNPRTFISLFFIALTITGFSGSKCHATPPSAGAAETHSILELSENHEKAILTRGISYFFETKPLSRFSAADLSDDQWETYPEGKTVYFDTRREAVWLRFEVRNSADHRTRWLMEIYWPHLDTIEVYPYHPDSGKWDSPMINGLTVPIDGRPFPHRIFVFPMQLPKDEVVRVYIRVKSGTKVVVPVAFYQEKEYEKLDRHYNLIFGMFFGILLIMLCYNLALYVFIQDRSYLFYSVYVFSIITYSLMANGYGPFYLWDHAPWLKANGYLLLSSFAFLAATLFFREFLSLKEYGGWIYRLNTVITGYWFVSMVIYAVSPHQFWVKMEDLAALITIFAGMYTAIYLWTKGNISARYFTIAWSFLIIGTFVLMLSLAGVIAFNKISAFSQMAGFIVEVILLSLALAERFNREKNRREAAQEVALELSHNIAAERKSKLEARKRLLEMQERTQEDLELQVKDHTLELEQALQRLEEANRELAALSTSDPLTKVHNRRYFDEVIDSEVRRAVRSRRPLCVMMADIDHFKAINDTHGHLIGDQCLRLVAKTIRRNAGRTNDLVARYGGEEFALVLSDITPSNALIVAERVRTSVEKLIFIDQGSPVKLRISIGIVGWIPLKEEIPANLIQIADQALYQAKKNGRNRVEMVVKAGDQMETSTHKGEGFNPQLQR